MLINCLPGCPGKRITTNASLDVDLDEVICEFCSKIVPVSKFVKLSMKQRGDIVRLDKRKPFQFDCTTCNKKVETCLEENKLSGLNCDQDCNFNVSKFIISAMKDLNKLKESNLEETETYQEELE
jgi:hypothetical protein